MFSLLVLHNASVPFSYTLSAAEDRARSIGTAGEKIKIMALKVEEKVCVFVSHGRLVLLPPLYGHLGLHSYVATSP